jgi:amidase
VAASLAQVAIGSETDGSIVCPGGMCGVVGHKPSLGLISRAGMVPISAHQDTPGPMTRHVVDAAITLSVLQGRDPLDEATSGYPADQPTDYAALLAPESLRGARIGVWRIPELGDGTAAVVRSTVRLLRSRGATVVEITMPYQDRIGELEFPALLTEFRHSLEAYLAGLDGGPKTIADLIEFNRDDPLEQACFPDQELFEESIEAPPPDSSAYLEGRAELTSLGRRSIDETLAAHRLDAIVAPSGPPAWRSDCATGDPDLKMYMSSSPAAVAGYPTITVPAGAVGNLPVGVSFLAGRWQDAKVLAYAAEFEQHAKARLTPRFRSA